MLDGVKKKKISVKAIAHWGRNFRMRFSVFPILSYQNACNECENAENQTWSEFFLTDESFGGSVQTWLTQREVVFIFLRAKISDSVCRDL